MTTTAHAYAHAERLKASGLKRVTVWVPNDEESRKKIHAAAKRIRKAKNILAPRDA